MKRLAIACLTLLASALPVFADAGFSDEWSIQSTIIFGILMGMPIFLPSALAVSTVAAVVRALIRKKRQQSGSRFGSTFLVSFCACTLLYLIGMAIFIGSVAWIESHQNGVANKIVTLAFAGR